MGFLLHLRASSGFNLKIIRVCQINLYIVAELQLEDEVIEEFLKKL